MNKSAQKSKCNKNIFLCCLILYFYVLRENYDLKISIEFFFDRPKYYSKERLFPLSNVKKQFKIGKKANCTNFYKYLHILPDLFSEPNK
jgi:hypothetical protein